MHEADSPLSNAIVIDVCFARESGQIEDVSVGPLCAM